MWNCSNLFLKEKVSGVPFVLFSLKHFLCSRPHFCFPLEHRTYWVLFLAKWNIKKEFTILQK